MSEETTGELADETLAALTVVEEYLATIETGHKAKYRLHELNHAKSRLRDAQTNVSEILYRYEEEHGPI